jgi:hypothetical protein
LRKQPIKDRILYFRIDRNKGTPTFLSAILDRDFTVDTTNNFLLLNVDFSYKRRSFSTDRFHSVLDQFDLLDINQNAYEILRTVRGDSANWFLNYESLFTRAHREKNVAEYWLYLENLLSYKRPRPKIKRIVSTIVLSNERQVHQLYILNTLKNSFAAFSEGINLLDLTSDQFQAMQVSLTNGIIPAEIRNISYPFIKGLVEDFDIQADTTFYENAFRYHYQILNETYEYRNFFIHKGIVNQQAKIKLSMTLPNLVTRLRQLIFKSLKEGKSELPFNLLIDQLFEQGEILRQPDLRCCG